MFCIYVELRSYIAHKAEYANIILFSFTLVNVVSCILLIVGAMLVRQVISVSAKWCVIRNVNALCR